MSELILPLGLLWCLGTLLLLFRRSIEPVWRVSALLIFLFYAAWFYPEWGASLVMWRDSFNKTLIRFAATLLTFIPLILLVLWPFVALTAFYSAQPIHARNLLRRVILVTLFFWIFWFLSHFTGSKVGEWSLKYLPEKITLPSTLPEMPSISVPDFMKFGKTNKK